MARAMITKPVEATNEEIAEAIEKLLNQTKEGRTGIVCITFKEFHRLVNPETLTTVGIDGATNVCIQKGLGSLLGREANWVLGNNKRASEDDDDKHLEFCLVRTGHDEQ